MNMNPSLPRIVLPRTDRPFIVGYMTAKNDSLMLTSRFEWGYPDTVNIAFFGVTFIDIAQRMSSLEISVHRTLPHKTEYSLSWMDDKTQNRISGNVHAEGEAIEFAKIPGFLGDKWGITGIRPIALEDPDSPLHQFWD